MGWSQTGWRVGIMGLGWAGADGLCWAGGGAARPIEDTAPDRRSAPLWNPLDLIPN